MPLRTEHVAYISTVWDLLLKTLLEIGFLAMSYLKVTAFILQISPSTAPELFIFFNCLHTIISIQSFRADFMRFQPEISLTDIQQARLSPFI